MPRRPSDCRLNCSAMTASKPMPAMLKKSRPSISPASIGRSRPWSATSIAACGSVGYADLGGEPVARAGRDDAKDGAGAGQRGADLVDGAVAAPGDDRPRSGRDGGARELAGVTRPLR